MLHRLGSFIVRRRRLVLVACGGVLVLMAVLAPMAFGVLQSGGFTDASSSSSRASALVDRDFGGEANLDVLVTPRDGQSLNSAPVTALAHRVAAQLAARSDVESVASYWDGHAAALRGKDGRSALITMYVTGSEQAQTNAAKAIVAQLDPAAGGTSRAAGISAAKISVGGPLAVNADITHGVAKSLGRAEAFAVPLTLVLLVLAFGSFLAALLPLAIGLFAVAGTFAELAVLGRITDVSIYAIDLTTALGLGLGVDYSLLMINRFREELRRAADGPGDPVRAAVIATLRSAGRTIMFSSVTVAVALAALLVFPVYFLRSFAYAGIGVVAIAALASLILLPALLATFGTRLARTRRLRIRRSPAPAPAGDSPFWRRVAITVMRRPVLIGGAVIAVLLVLGVPFLHVTFGTPGAQVLPTSTTSRQVAGVLRTDYSPAVSAPIDVVLDGRVPQPAITAYAEHLRELPNAGPVQDVATRDGATYLRVTGPSDAESAAALQLVRDIRAVPAPGPGTVLVGGSAAALIDTLAAVSGGLPWALLSIALTTFVLLFLFTGSVVLPIKALALNALSLTAVFGALVWIFQDGHLAGLLGFTPGPTDVSMILLIFCIAFGLSMDYEVFLLARIKEAHDAGADTVEAVATGLARTGRIVTTAAVLLAITFFAFGTAQVSFIQLFGIGTGIAIVLDATVIRGLLVPAFMRLAGQLNWWSPPALRRLHQRIGLAEATQASVNTERPGRPTRASRDVPVELITSRRTGPGS
jgi:RND superfamily putative drug exporter